MRGLALLLLLVSADPLIEKMDRMRVVGAPVLPTAPRGIHVWLEDGWYNIAAVSALPVGGQKARNRDFSVNVRSTKAISKLELGEWRKVGGGEDSFTIIVAAGPDPEIMKFKTEGDLTISNARTEGDSTPIYLGPTAKRAAATVQVGRY